MTDFEGKQLYVVRQGTKIKKKRSTLLVERDPYFHETREGGSIEEKPGQVCAQIEFWSYSEEQSTYRCTNYILIDKPWIFMLKQGHGQHSPDGQGNSQTQDSCYTID